MIANYNNQIAQYQKDLQTLLTDPAHSGAVSSVADIMAVQFKDATSPNECGTSPKKY